jgi:hypothetical protein
MADADISLVIFWDTENTIVPKKENIKIMGSSRENPLRLFCLFGVSFIENLHFQRSGGTFGLKEENTVNR